MQLTVKGQPSEWEKTFANCLTQATITKCHTKWLKNIYLIVLKAGKSKIRVLADMALYKGPLPLFQMGIFFLYSYMRERSSSGVSSSYKIIYYIMGAAPP